MPDPETIAVPDLVSLTQSAAEAKLKSAGLVVIRYTLILSSCSLATMPGRRTRLC